MNNKIALTNMIKQQLRTGDVLNEPILELFKSIPREAFVPQQYKPFAYSDMPIPLAHGQCMMLPLEEATLLQALGLKGHEVVLEIGTGTGFLTALLSRLCKQVISVDYYADFTANARLALANQHCTNVELFTGNAAKGWLDKAPYDVIIFTAAQQSLPDITKLQLLPGGKLFAIIGEKPIMQAQLHTLNHDETWHQRVLFETEVPSLIQSSSAMDFVF